MSFFYPKLRFHKCHSVTKSDTFASIKQVFLAKSLDILAKNLEIQAKRLEIQAKSQDILAKRLEIQEKSQDVLRKSLEPEFWIRIPYLENYELREAK
jgi:hypothetical protein